MEKVFALQNMKLSLLCFFLVCLISTLQKDVLGVLNSESEALLKETIFNSKTGGKELSNSFSDDENFDALMAALRNGDRSPNLTVIAAMNHNSHVISSGGGCRRYGPKIVNLGLPRTGTLSFIKVMRENFGLSNFACHQLPNNWQGYLNEIKTWRNNPRKIGPKLKKALRMCTAFADIPNFALYDSFESQFPTTRFVMTVRGLESWLNSTEMLMKTWKGKINKSQLRFINNFFGVSNSLGWERNKYAATWEHHTLEMISRFQDRLLLLPVELSDQSKLDALSSFIGCSPNMKTVYARSHVSNVHSLGKKCVKTPKKCGF